jgi:hypothetical protein
VERHAIVRGHLGYRMARVTPVRLGRSVALLSVDAAHGHGHGRVAGPTLRTGYARVSISTDHRKRSLATLERSLNMLASADAGSVEYEVFRNAVVKGFELSLETSAKLLRRSLKPFFASPGAVDKLSYKDGFRHAAKHGLVSLDEVERWFSYRDNRNNTAHDYGLLFAEETLRLIPSFVADARAQEVRLADADA